MSDDKVARLKHRLERFGYKEGNVSRKDGWDKFRAISTFLGTVVIAGGGVLITVQLENRASIRESRIKELDVVTKMLPHLASDENEQVQRLAWAAIHTLGSTNLAAGLAELTPTQAAVDVMFTIAGSPDRSDKDRQIASEALEKIWEVEVSTAIDRIEYDSLDRDISTIHIHHTWMPSAKQYENGSVEQMYRFQTDVMGEATRGPHFLISPTGGVWLARPLQMLPASIKGHNTGAISVTLIINGDEEMPSDAQALTSGQLLQSIMTRFSLTERDIILHSELSNKACPGKNISRSFLSKAIARANSTKP